MDRTGLMRVNGSIQPRTTFTAPVDLGLRTGETMVLRPEEGSGPGRLLALLESALATQGRGVTGTIQILAAIDEQGRLAPITSVPTFFADVDPISPAIGNAYYATVDSTRDPVTKEIVEPSPLNIGNLLTDLTIPVVANASGFNRHTALLAQSGAGKSYALGVLLEEFLANTLLRLVVIDPNGDFALVRELPEAANVTVVESRDPKRYRTAIRKLTQKNCRGVVLNLNPLEPVLWDSVVGDVLALLWERRDEQRASMVIIDEAHNFAPAGDATSNVGRLVMRLAGEGRKYGLWLMLASQRPQKLHGNVISQCDNLVLMRIASQIDLDHIASSFGAVDRNMMQLASGFRSGSAMVIGRIVKSPTLMKFRERRLPEAGGDISLGWCCSH